MKRIMIIGASSGIGRELATRYAQQGHRVAVTARRQPLLQELVDQWPNQVLAAAWDVREMHNESRLEELVNRLGGLDLVIICAGLGEVSRSLDRAIDETTIQTNVDAFAQIACWAFNYLAQNGGGQLANISSMAAFRGSSFAPAYSASKAFQLNYFEALRIKARREQIPVRVTDVRPGFVRTRMAQGDRQFWVVPLEKAGRQIQQGIDAGREKFYVSRRWRCIGWLMRMAPYAVYKRVG